MMMKSKLALAVAAAALSAGASASTTMYNTFTTAATTETDGWTHTNGKVNSGPLQPWLGTGANFTDTRPFNYAGNAHLNWAIQLSGPGDSGEISAADSTARYSPAGTTPDANYTGPAEIDTGGGAWQDNGTDTAGNPTASGPTGWRHQTDIGLIKASADAYITLKPSTLGAQSPTFSRFGITVFTGMDSTATTYTHHGSWNCPGCVSGSTPPTAQPRPYDNSNPFYFVYANSTATTPTSTGSGVVYDPTLATSVPGQAYSDNVDGQTGFTFLAQAGQVYSIYLGGVGFARWNTGVDNYKLEVSASPVPIPAAAWLLASALGGMGVFGRRKDKAA